MKKLMMILVGLALSVSAVADLIGDNDVYKMGTRKVILSGTSAQNLSQTVFTSQSDIVYLTFSSENAATAVVGYDNGTAPVAYIPIAEDTSIKVGPVNGYYSIICSNCGASTAVTVTVDVY